VLLRGTSTVLATTFALAPMFGVLLIEGFGMPAEVGVFVAIAGGLGFAWKFGRWFIRRGHRSFAAQVARIAERLAEKARASIKG
jgi:hypothetical protein